MLKVIQACRGVGVGMTGLEWGTRPQAEPGFGRL